MENERKKKWGEKERKKKGESMKKREEEGRKKKEKNGKARRNMVDWWSQIGGEYDILNVDY